MRFWTLIPWAFLTLGITAGSWWAYYELGWGGWWFWDPVENASLLPWLTSTALLHSLIVTEKRQNLLRWSAFLSILTFFFSLSGTFLVRSGLLTSVHSFAADPSRGILIFLMIVLVMTYAFWHFFVRFRSLATTGVFAPLSKESSIVFNNVMLCSIAGTVFLGTIYPLILDMFNGPQVSVGAPYFQATVVPMVAPLTILMGVGPLLRWKQSDLRALFSRLQFALTAACAAILLTWYLQEKGPTLVIGAVGLAVWLIVATLINWYKTIFPQKDIRSHFFQRIFRIPINSHGMSIAHLGSALLILGMCLDVLGGQEKIQLMGIGDKIKLSHYQLTLADVKQVRGPNYHAEQASIKVAYRGKEFAQLHPERRFYPVEKSVTTDVALLTVGVSDLYGVLGDFHRNGQWTTRFYYHPFVDLIWIGAIFMAFGGGLAAWGRRKI
jgi:cytochrome c-type biogenesis protein CcmF